MESLKAINSRIHWKNAYQVQIKAYEDILNSLYC